MKFAPRPFTVVHALQLLLSLAAFVTAVIAFWRSAR